MSFSDAAGGLCAGVTGTLIGYPLDTVKTRMQTSASPLSMFAVGGGILKREGAKAFYKGVATPLLSLSVLSTLNFTCYSYLKSSFSDPASGRAGPLGILSAGALCGPVAAVFSTPEHLLKTKLQVDNAAASPRFTRGSLHAARLLVGEGGARALYVGAASNLVRESVFLSTYFLSYETLKAKLSPAVGLSAIPVAGGLAGALGWFVSYPLDCVKSNVMVNGGGRMLEVGRSILREKGVAGLYSGLSPSIARSFLVSGSRFSAYELGKRVYERAFPDPNHRRQ